MGTQITTAGCERLRSQIQTHFDAFYAEKRRTPPQSTASRHGLVTGQETTHVGGDGLSVRYRRTRSHTVFAVSRAPRMPDDGFSGDTDYV